jgi:hypothetical protein
MVTRCTFYDRASSKVRENRYLTGILHRYLALDRSLGVRLSPKPSQSPSITGATTWSRSSEGELLDGPVDRCSHPSLILTDAQLVATLSRRPRWHTALERRRLILDLPPRRARGTPPYLATMRVLEPIERDGTWLFDPVTVVSMWRLRRELRSNQR